jgi:predicted nucleic acid-binding protein
VIVVDTNLFIRYLIGVVVPTDAPLVVAANGLFDAVQDGREQIATNDAVIAEVVFILHAPRHYGLPRAEVSQQLLAILSHPGCQIKEKERVLRAFPLWVERPRLSFVDALTAAQALWTKHPLATFDEALAELPGFVPWRPDPH